MTRKPAESQDQDKAQATVPNTVVKGTNPGVGVSAQGSFADGVLAMCTWCERTAPCWLWPEEVSEDGSPPELMCDACIYAAEERAIDGD